VRVPRADSEPRVLVVLDGAMGWSRGVLRGFFDAARTQKWRLLRYQPGDITWLVDVWQPDAIVLQAALCPGVKKLASTIVVSVNDDRGDEPGIASVCLEEATIGRLAAEHLLAKGLSRLTTFRFNDGPFAITRERAFEEAAKTRGASLVPKWWRDGAVPPRFHEQPAALSTWISGLPKSTGVFACTDSWAAIVARYAEFARVRIPEDLAVIGADNDLVDCELTSPPLSSVAIPWQTVGKQAAELVARALSGTDIAGTRLTVSPLDVVARRSTEVSAIADPVVAAAVTWLTEHVSQCLTLDAVARAAGCSRQRLEQRFRAAIGRTVMQEVSRARVERAKRLCSNSNLTLAAIAEQCGFADATTLSVAFRRETGMPPGAYGRMFRALTPPPE